MTVRRPEILVVALAAGMLLLGGCFFGTSGADCAPGDKVQCACPDGTPGEQVCRDDGSYGACQCGVLADGGATGTGGSGTDAGSSGGGGTGGGGTGGTTDGGSTGGGTGGGGISCGPGLTACNGVCVDLTSDPAHCGSCGRPCPAAASCNQSACLCPGSQTMCNDACTDTQSDALNCGSCGHACPVTQACVGGHCQTPQDCTTQGCTGLNYCDSATHTCVPGCSQDSQCSGSKTCDTTTHACTCPTGLTDCSGTCVDLTNDGAHCGSCGNACTGSQVCLASKCHDQSTACAGYDPTGRLSACGGSTACTSGSLQCLSLSYLAPTSVCVDATPCQSNPTAVCCGSGEFCGTVAGANAYGTGATFCCVPGETLDSDGDTCGDAGAVIGCTTDSDCPAVWRRPYCDTQLSPPHCVACRQDSQCANGERCYTTDGTCVACLSSSDCTGGQVCNTSSHTCVDCVNDSQCGGTTPACDTATNTCVECTQNANCTDPAKPGCNTRTHSCVQCTMDSQCTSAAAPYCDGTSDTCVACTQDSQCTSASKPYCAGGTCSVCPAGSTCTSVGTNVKACLYSYPGFGATCDATHPCPAGTHCDAYASFGMSFCDPTCN